MLRRNLLQVLGLGFVLPFFGQTKKEPVRLVKNTYEGQIEYFFDDEGFLIKEIHPIEGTKHYDREGRLHREDGPAVYVNRKFRAWEMSGGLPKKYEKVWYKHGVEYRENGPSSIHLNGKDKLCAIWHRENGNFKRFEFWPIEGEFAKEIYG